MSDKNVIHRYSYTEHGHLRERHYPQIGYFKVSCNLKTK